MDIRWLEDFITLSEVGSFSKASALRHSSQPAFSRRIQSLESWVGSDLIDRTSYPTKLTTAGVLFYEQALSILTKANEARHMLRHAQTTFIEFAVPHNLSLNFFPKWLYRMQANIGNIPSRLRAVNVHDGVMMLLEGGCDLLMIYHHPYQPIELNKNQYHHICLGQEKFAPYSRADWQGKPLHSIAHKQNNVPFLAYSPNAYLGRMSHYLLEKQDVCLDKCYETDMAEALKFMTIEGHGMAFLPETAIHNEIENGILVRADDVANGIDLSTTLEIRLYKHLSNSHNITHKNQEMLNSIWEYLSEH
ncbi:MAG: hypothetical protein RLZZ210_38 [Pseudomonadota bacterium]|jgi:DNA-binding transcriptional LysR family regulator